MTSIAHPTPAPFTGDDYATRMTRVVHDAVAVGLDGVLVTPGPDLVWLAGYRPTAITERLTILVLCPDRQPTMVVPARERSDAESAEGTAAVSLVEWADGTDPYPVAGALLDPAGRYGISDMSTSCRRLSPVGVNARSRPSWRSCCADSGTSRLISPSSDPDPTAPIRTTRPVTG